MHYLNEKEINLHYNIFFLMAYSMTYIYQNDSEFQYSEMEPIQRRAGMYTLVGHPGSYLYLIDSLVTDAIVNGASFIKVIREAHGFRIYTDKAIENIHRFLYMPCGKPSETPPEELVPLYRHIFRRTSPVVVNALCYSFSIIHKEYGEYKMSCFRYGKFNHSQKQPFWSESEKILCEINVCHGVGDEDQFFFDHDQTTSAELSEYIEFLKSHYPNITFESN